MNYRSLSDVNGTVPCGSQTNKDKSFFLPSGSQCPPNGIIVQPKSSPVGSEFKYNNISMSGIYQGYQVTNNNSNTLLADLRISLSPMCGDLSDDYMERPVKINAAMRPGWACNYYNEDEYRTQFHPLFSPTGFTVMETDVYVQNNGILNQIKAQVPINDEDFTKNSYRLWYKTFSTLKTECQGRYSTQQIEAAGMKAGDVTTSYRQVLIVSIVIYILMFLGAFVITCCCLSPVTIFLGVVEKIG